MRNAECARLSHQQERFGSTSARLSENLFIGFGSLKPDYLSLQSFLRACCRSTSVITWRKLCGKLASFAFIPPFSAIRESTKANFPSHYPSILLAWVHARTTRIMKISLQGKYRNQLKQSLDLELVNNTPSFQLNQSVLLNSSYAFIFTLEATEFIFFFFSFWEKVVSLFNLAFEFVVSAHGWC